MRSGGARRNRIASPSANCTSSVDRFRSRVRASLPKRAAIQPVSKLTIVGVARHWAEAWHGGDPAGMAACLHPDLDHRILQVASGEGDAVETVRDLLGVQAQLGRSVNPAARKVEVRVLDVHGRSASARVDLGPWCAYVHLAAHRQGWGIASVMWEWQGGPAV